MLYSGLLDIIITIVLNVLVWSRRLSVAEPAWREGWCESGCLVWSPWYWLIRRF